MTAAWANTPSLCTLAGQAKVSFSLYPHQDNEFVFILRRWHSVWTPRTWSLAGWNARSIPSSRLLQWWQVRSHQSQGLPLGLWGLCHCCSSSGTAPVPSASLCSQSWGSLQAADTRGLEGQQCKQRHKSGCEASVSRAGRRFHPHSVIAPLRGQQKNPHGQRVFEALVGLFLQLSICSALWSLLTCAISINTFLRFLFTRVATSEGGSRGTR